MLTLSVAGKSSSETLKEIRDGLTNDNENELKILINVAQFDEIKKFLVSQGYDEDNIVLEDDDGFLYVNASREKSEDTSEPTPEPAATPTPAPAPVPEPVAAVPAPPVIASPNTTGILISCEKGKQKTSFLKKFLASLVKAQIKPDVIALVNSAVKLAAYDSQSCEYLKKLEDDGVQILISESCADKIGMTEAAGVGVIVDMSEIFEEIFSCGKVFSV